MCSVHYNVSRQEAKAVWTWRLDKAEGTGLSGLVLYAAKSGETVRQSRTVGCWVRRRSPGLELEASGLGS